MLRKLAIGAIIILCGIYVGRTYFAPSKPSAQQVKPVAAQDDPSFCNDVVGYVEKAELITRTYKGYDRDKRLTELRIEYDAKLKGVPLEVLDHAKKAIELFVLMQRMTDVTLSSTPGKDDHAKAEKAFSEFNQLHTDELSKIRTVCRRAVADWTLRMFR